MEYESSISEHFNDLDDPRKSGIVKHNLLDILTISICVIVSGANGWSQVETFAKTKKVWLKNFLELPNGIPSHDMFNRVMNRLPALKFQGKKVQRNCECLTFIQPNLNWLWVTIK